MEEISYKKHNKVSGIYKISWVESGYFYYGQSVDLFARKRQHMCDFRKNKHLNGKMMNCYLKHGIPSFECVIICDRSDLSKNEQFFIDKYFGKRLCCNLSPCANGTFVSEITKRKISEIRKGTKSSISAKLNITESLKKSYAEGIRKSFVAGRSGSDNFFFGKKHTNETRLKMRIEKPLLKGSSNNKSKPVMNKITGIFYETIKEASLSTSLTVIALRKRIAKGKTDFIVI